MSQHALLRHGSPAARWVAVWLALVFACGCGASPGPASLAPLDAEVAQIQPDSAALGADARDAADLEAADAHDVAFEEAFAADADAAAALDAADVAATIVWVHHPAAQDLTLRGDTPPLAWATDLLPATVQGKAARFVLPVATQTIRVKAMRKGAWAIGANHVVQPGEERHLYPYFDAKSATGRREDFALPGPFGGTRTLRAWLPPGYDENTTASYPLLLMHDGQNLFEDETASFGVAWQLDAAAQGSLDAAKLTEIVAVGIDHAGTERIYEYTPWPDPSVKIGTGGGAGAYLGWVEGAVLPDLKGRYRLVDAREARVLGGSSLGALVSLYAVLANPEVWGGAVCMSGAWWWADDAILAWAAGHLPQLPVRVWLDAGTVDDGADGTLAVRDVLQSLGILPPLGLGFLIAQGADHSEGAWSKRVHLALRFFFDPGDREPAF